MLLGSSPNRRLMKDERQSPAIAEAAASGMSLSRCAPSMQLTRRESRAWLQAADIARRLSRGDQLHENV
jgi:hypothetical protein